MIYTLDDIKNAYNAGYDDAKVNHVNDAETYCSELVYSRRELDKDNNKSSKRTITMTYDGEIMYRYKHRNDEK